MIFTRLGCARYGQGGAALLLGVLMVGGSFGSVAQGASGSGGPLDAQAVPVSGWTGMTGQTGNATGILPGGSWVRVATTSSSGADWTLFGLGWTPGQSATSAMFSPQMPLTGSWLLFNDATASCPANTTCPRGTLSVAFQHPVRDPVLHVLAVGELANGVGGYTRLTLTGPAGGPAGVSLRAPIATGNNLAVTGGNTVTLANPAVPGSPGCTGTAGCGSVRANGTVTSLAFGVDLVNLLVGAPVVDSWYLAVSVDEDFSNAPVSYGNASHVLSDVFLGASATADDPDVITTAAGRDTADVNDANPMFPPLTPASGGSTYTIHVPVTGGGSASTLAGWIDFNNDGTYDAAERATVAVPAHASTAALTWTVPGGANLVAAATNARLRIGYDATQMDSPTGMADSGEVEDYPLTIAAASPTTPAANASPAALPVTEGQTPPLPVTGTNTWTLAGIAAALILLGSTVSLLSRRRGSTPHN
jgi:GEVED domain